MGSYTQDTARWLDRRYSRVAADGVYQAHMPIYGLNHPASEAGHLVRHAISYRLLKELNELEFESLLAVGGGEGFLPHLVRGAFGTAVTDLDLSVESVRRAFDFFGISGVAADATRLPFRDGAFDVVVCSEVIEHLEFPVEAMLELVRVARRAVVLTTLEYEPDPAVVARHRFQRCRFPHFEQNLFLEDDLRLVFGPSAQLLSQFRQPVPPDGASHADAAQWLRVATSNRELFVGGGGVLVLLEKLPSRCAPRRTHDELLEGLLEGSAVAAGPLVVKSRATCSDELLRLLVCPFDGTALVREADGLRSAGGRTYEVRGGVPVLYDLAAADPTEAELVARVGDSHAEELLEALVALRRDVVGDQATARLAFDFTDPAQRRGWLVGPDLSEAPARSGGLAFVATGPDPWMASPIVGLAFSSVRGVRVRMRVHAPDVDIAGGVGQLFWLLEDDDDLGEDRSTTFAVQNSPDVLEYRVELGPLPQGSPDRRILLFRLDPADGPCRIEVLEFAVLT